MDVLFKNGPAFVGHIKCPQKAKPFLKALPRFLHNFKSPCTVPLKTSSPAPQTNGSSGVKRHQGNLHRPWSLPKKC